MRSSLVNPSEHRRACNGHSGSPQCQQSHAISRHAALKSSVDTLFKNVGIDSIAASNQHSAVALLDDIVMAAVTWNCGDPLERIFRGVIAADEDHPAVETALDAILYRFSSEATRGGPALLRLVIPKGQVITSQLANEHGFGDVDGGVDHLLSCSASRYAFSETWPEFRKNVERLSASRFPENPPVYSLSEPDLTFEGQDGTKRVISLADLESTMSPSCFILPGRAGVIVRIQPHFASQLLDTSQQMTFLPAHGALTFHQRVYYSAAKNAQLLSPGTIAVFYESAGDDGRGRSAAVAIARILSTSVVEKTEVSGNQIERGVLDEDGVGRITARDKVAVTTFDNVIRFSSPVYLKQLREIGCVDGVNMVSATRHSRHLSALVARGFGA